MCLQHHVVCSFCVQRDVHFALFLESLAITECSLTVNDDLYHLDIVASWLRNANSLVRTVSLFRNVMGVTSQYFLVYYVYSS